MEDFSPVFANRRVVGALHDRSFAFETPTKLEDIKDWSLGTRNIDLSFPSHSSKGILSRNEKEGLIELYSRLYSVQSSSVEIPSSYVRFTYYCLGK